MRSAVLVFACLAWTLPSGAAEPPVLLDVPPLCVKAPGAEEQASAMAWVAVCEMVLRHRVPGSTHQLCDLMESGYRLKPGEACSNPAFTPPRGLGLEDIRRVLGDFGVLAQPFSKPNGPTQLETQLRKGRLVIVQLTPNSVASRLVLVRGLEYRKMVAQRTKMGLSLLPGGGVAPVQEMMEQEVPIVLINDPLSPTPRKVNLLQLLTHWVGALCAE